MTVTEETAEAKGAMEQIQRLRQNSRGLIAEVDELPARIGLDEIEAAESQAADDGYAEALAEIRALVGFAVSNRLDDAVGLRLAIAGDRSVRRAS